VKPIIKYIAFLVLIILTDSCANKGMPSGGPKDEDPPVLLKSKPLINQKNFTGKQVELLFDENVVLKEISKNFIISPPLEEEPDIKAYAKRVIIELNNELQPNTTYTIYFGSSIVDNNEGNPYKDLTFSFSTGEVVDSMEISGIVIKAENLDPQEGVIVGIYSDLSDSACIKHVPLRIARTNAAGEFSIKNVAPGEYKIYALKEGIRNYRFDLGGEEFAFIDTVIVPWYDSIQVPDTVWIDSVTVDTVMWNDALIYGPYNMLLQTFVEDFFAQNLRKKERLRRECLQFSFSSTLRDEPKLRLLNKGFENTPLMTEKLVNGDTILYWITDSNIYKTDTLIVDFEYQKTDSLQQLYWQRDTFEMLYRKPVDTKTQRRKAESKATIPMFEISHNIKSSMELKSPMVISFAEPVSRFNFEGVRLYYTDDTLKLPLKVNIYADSIMQRKYIIEFESQGGKSYTLEIDTASIDNVFGLTNDKFKSSFTVKKEDQYGNITFELSKLPYPGIVYLVDAKDQPIRKSVFDSNTTTKVDFKLVTPGSYYFRLYYDVNENDRWDSGNYLKHIQPEPIRYYPKKIEIKAYRDYLEEWDVEALDLTRQKPKDLVGVTAKNKR
jgi:hypothetical protein